MPPDGTPESAQPPQNPPSPSAPTPPASPAPPSQEELPDLPKWVQRLIYQWVGRRGLVIVAVLIMVVPLVWSNWSTVRDLPVVATIRTWVAQAPLPTADPQRFAVALAHLAHDEGQHYEELIIRDLMKNFAGDGDERAVQVLRFDRTVSLEGAEPEAREKAGHDQARQYLRTSGADVLIWGVVHRIGGQTAPRLYWTTSQESKHVKATNDVYVVQPNAFKLPDLFWNDLAEVLHLVVATENSKFLAQEGRFIADQLTRFITRAQRLLGNNAGRQGWSDIQFVLGNALAIFGEQTGTNQSLEEAVAAYRAALTERTRERMPLDWATTQNNLGVALQTLGERESGTARLEEAVAAYHEALKECTRERVPLQWATTQNNLGNALQTLGERARDVTLICEALEKQLMAWEVFVKSSPYYTSVVVNNAKSTIAALKNTFDASTSEACITRQQKRLKRMRVL